MHGLDLRQRGLRIQVCVESVPWQMFPQMSNSNSDTYRLKNAFNASNFFDEFDFFTASDPSHGTVQYESKESALNLGLASTKDSSIPTINGQSQGVVHLAAHAGQVPAASTGRPSIRLTSQQKYNKGLFVVDLTHTPVAECGIWPAL